MGSFYKMTDYQSCSWPAVLSSDLSTSQSRSAFTTWNTAKNYPWYSCPPAWQLQTISATVWRRNEVMCICILIILCKVHWLTTSHLHLKWFTTHYFMAVKPYTSKLLSVKCFLESQPHCYTYPQKPSLFHFLRIISALCFYFFLSPPENHSNIILRHKSFSHFALYFAQLLDCFWSILSINQFYFCESTCELPLNKICKLIAETHTVTKNPGIHIISIFADPLHGPDQSSF